MGTGIQSVFQNDKSKYEQAVGLSWNSIFGHAYVQRDISAHVLYAHHSETLEYGTMAVLDMHHVLMEKGLNISSYDETFGYIIPYINLIFYDNVRVYAALPLGRAGASAQLGMEWLIGRRVE